MSYLSCLPIDIVKIDRSLVPSATGKCKTLPLTRAIIAMGHSLGMKVLAEGIETQAQLEMLETLRCDQFQGFHFCPPSPAEHIEALLRAGGHMPVTGRRLATRNRTVMVVDDEAPSLNFV